jgi:hypothetical protein
VMSVPGFTASIPLSGRGLGQASGTPPDRVVPAIAGDQAADYMECVRECKGEGESATTCQQRCLAQTPQPGHGTAPGTSGIAIYGNYCGPGHGDPTGLTPPVDAVDAACRAHDMCYDATNYFNCGCDRALLNALPGAIAATPTAAGKAAGTLIQAHFMGQPCVCASWFCVLMPHLCLGVGGQGAIC